MTAALYAIDGEANQRLIDQERERRAELIETAVSSFAPQLAGKTAKAIHLYSSNSSLRKYFREICGSDTVLVEYCKADGRERRDRHEIQQEGADVWLDIPKRADLVATRSNLNAKTELLAAQLGALPIVLPEATDYLMARLEKAGALVVVGAEQGRK